MLSLHSTLFNDMFLLPQLASEERIDDLPVVDLYGDSADDLAEFINAMYSSARYGYLYICII